MDTQATASQARIIRAVAPIRICDMGGWTDTWFAGHGAVFNLAVTPGAEVEVVARPRGPRGEQVVLHAENYAQRFALGPGAEVPPPLRLLAAAVAELPPPPDVAVEVTIYSEVPAGCSTGTSAAVCVALLAALDRLTPGQMTAHELAYAAHRVETQRLGLQSGIQDQLCAAYGGANFIEMFAYPHASVSQLRLPAATLWELEQRLLLVYLGRSHSSSAVHERVIAGLEAEGASSPRLERLRRTAREARDALYADDMAAFGAAMASCTAGQAELHPELVSQDAWRAIEVARRRGASGWKINGAGGEGGSLTVLCGPAPGARRQMAEALAASNPRLRMIPIGLCPWGARAWEPRAER